MYRILFVDDEILVLDGLRRMLRCKRKEWHMTFVSSAEAALEVMLREAVDVLVTDMMMPGTSGLELIGRSQDLLPDIRQIVLSGQCAWTDAHHIQESGRRFLGKPCGPGLLINSIENELELLEKSDRYRVPSKAEALDHRPVLNFMHPDLSRSCP